MFQIHSLKRWLFTFYSLLYLILKYLELETKLDFKKIMKQGVHIKIDTLTLASASYF